MENNHGNLIDDLEFDKLTPGMKQFVSIKKENMDCLVLFRMGDFYETFYDDAIRAAQILNITLTGRGKGDNKVPLAGIPYHALETYLKRLINHGEKVCIVEQLEDPKQAKGVVKRGVVRIITPGTIIEDSLLQPTQNNYLMSVFLKMDTFGLSLCDVSTGEVHITQGKGIEVLLAEIEKWHPSELIITNNENNILLKKITSDKKILITRIDEEEFKPNNSIQTCKNKYKKLDDSYTLGKEIALQSFGPMITYITNKLQRESEYMSFPKWYSVYDFMILDEAAQKNLELVHNRDGNTKNTLFSVLNKTVTGMGSRQLKRIILQPSMKPKIIAKRQKAIKEFLNNELLLDDVRESLKKCGDLERLGAKVSFGNITPKEIVTLKDSMLVFEQLQDILNYENIELFNGINEIKDHKKLIECIQTTIKDEPSTLIREGNIIREGYSSDLDEIRSMATNSKEWLRNYEEQERIKTGIKTLKVKYNRVFGYFIEVTKANVHLVPDYYIRKQTQVNSERYITDELKEKEAIILGARERINTTEYELFMRTVQKVAKFQETIKSSGRFVALIDSMASLAIVAGKQNYVPAQIVEEQHIEITKGRHPVIEQTTVFIPNNCSFAANEFMHVITGPNMAGKSTYLRQVALIAVMAQIGSYVPAQEAKLPLFDRVFTRVGASDNLAKGESTFMVEMTETANILHNATERSLVILDEIGRGTSTYDGFSLAWAIAEYLLTNIKSKSLFATHYHQLNTLENEYEGVKNYHSTIEETDDGLVFLRKIIPGSTDKSFGVHVAKLAGLPDKVIEKARSVMENLEREDEILKKMEKKQKLEQNTLTNY